MHLQQLRQLLLNRGGPLRRRHHFGHAILGLVAAAIEHQRLASGGVLLVPFNPQRIPDSDLTPTKRRDEKEEEETEADAAEFKRLEALYWTWLASTGEVLSTPL